MAWKNMKIFKYEVRPAVFFWGFSHPSKGNVFIGQTKNEDHVLCLVDSLLA